MDRYICIHGHFYQPPRENPWLEDVELQDSAFPYHDWNERITAECYAPNGAARIQDSEGRILDILNNYSRISFNFGPSLLSWMEKHAPKAYRSILDSDRQSREKFSGHGAAMAQCYNHLIMPLASSRDKRTQVLWGIHDFRHRFGRAPEGMWLPETAVDLESLDLMAEQGIRFTILSPYQAHRVRPGGKGKWEEADDGRIDPKRAYLCHLPSGRSIALFFYDGPVAQEVAFSDMLKRGEDFAHRLTGTFSVDENPQLVHIATDGETYGHHHRFGDMALAYCLSFIEERGLARLTVYGEFLKKHPPVWEVQIQENTSWSCAHGVERWRADCGCRIGGEDWHQRWRGPVREALDWLRDQLEPLFVRELGKLVRDPWQARDEYIEVILNRSATRDFLRRHCGREPNAEETVQALKLLEMQRQAMLMYTSCGWFFDEVSGIESTQILLYAGRAVQLAQTVAGIDLESEFLRRLEKAPSNLPKWRNARQVYEMAVKPARIDLDRVAAHHAISSLFENGEKRSEIYCYSAEDATNERLRAGLIQLAVGRSRIRSSVTLSEGVYSYAVLHLGAQNLNAGVRACRGESAFAEMRTQLREALERSDIPGIVRLMDQHFGSHTYTLWHLFKDEQRIILRQLMEAPLAEIENSFRTIYTHHFALVRFLKEIEMPAPPQLAGPMEIALNAQLLRLLEEESPDPKEIRRLAVDVRKLGIQVDQTGLGRLSGRRVQEFLAPLADHPDDLERLRYLLDFLDACREATLKVHLWQPQNTFFALFRPSLSRLSDAALEPFLELGRQLRIKVD
ncbi:MAG: DUF3536 domain-containing protein [Desulfuromonadales bacterium]